MTNRTGATVDIHARDRTGPGVAKAQANLNRLQTTLDANARSASRLGQTFELLRGGAAIAGIAALASEMGVAGDKMKTLADDIERGNLALEEMIVRGAEAVPIFGRITEGGRKLSEGLIELTTREESRARLQRERDAAFQKEQREQMIEQAKERQELEDARFKREIDHANGVLARMKEQLRLANAISGVSLPTAQTGRLLSGQRSEFQTRQSQQLIETQRQLIRNIEELAKQIAKRNEGGPRQFVADF